LRGYSTSNPQVYYHGPWINSCIILCPRGRSRLFIITYVHLFHSFSSALGLSYPFLSSPEFCPSWTGLRLIPVSFLFRLRLIRFHFLMVLDIWENLELIRLLLSVSFDFFFEIVRAVTSTGVHLLLSSFVSVARLFFCLFCASLYFSCVHSNPPSTRR